MATNDKYDRQLRLWGASGQKRLAESCIVLINATAAGTETLKNLVLPGIGRFHIIDDALVSPTKADDPFSNFFVFSKDSNHAESVPKSRAEIATQHLMELNPDVAGSFTAVDSLQHADYHSILSSLAVAYNHLLIIAADLPSCVLLPLSSLCWKGIGGGMNATCLNDDIGGGIPLIIVKSYGLIGSVRVQTPHHPIIESKPDNPKPDLRLASTLRNPSSFPELHKLADSTNLDDMDRKEHCHVPYVILLFKAMGKWRKEQESKSNTSSDSTRLPQNAEEKKEFQKALSSLSKNMEQELNFIEASKNYYLAYTELELPFEVQELIDNIEDYHVEGDKAPMDTFHVLLLALKTFLDTHDGFPPLNGSIPDMTASTQGYIELQKIYKCRAEKDKDDMRRILSDIRDKYGDGIIPVISEEELSSFCKNIYNLRLVKTRSYEQEYKFDYGDEKEDIIGDFIMGTYDPYEVPEHTPLLWYIALRACDAFYDEHGYYPGRDGRELALESDATCVQKHIVDIVNKMDIGDNDLIQSTLLSTSEETKNAFAKEVTRYNNAEIHNIASVIGGVASQEAVKLITRQYIPIEGTYIFNGIAGVASTVKL